MLHGPSFSQSGGPCGSVSLAHLFPSSIERDLVSRRLQPDALNGGLVVLWESVECFFPVVASDF